MLFSRVCLLMTFVVTARTVNETNELYETTQQESRKMMLRVQQSFAAVHKTCRNLCGEIVPRRYHATCLCDEKCEEFRDCCLDYWENCNSSFTMASKKERIFKCVLSSFRLSVNSTKRKQARELGYEVVTKCPKSFQNLRIKNRCELPQEDILPFVEGRDGISYRNHYCAECHQAGDIIRWNTRLNCSKETDMLVAERLRAGRYKFSKEERRLIRETCLLHFKPPLDVNGTRCWVETECNDTNNTDCLKCTMYRQRIYSFFDPSIVYKNPHCARWSGTPMELLKARHVYIDDNEKDVNEKYASLGILFDFTKSSQIYGLKEVQIEETCAPGEIYDKQLKRCREKQILNQSPLLRNWTCQYGNETLKNSTEFITIFQNLTIYVPAHKKMYTKAEYFWINSSIVVCGNFTVTYFKTTLQKLRSQYTQAEYYITVIGLSLSILALLAVIFTYLLFSELRGKLPGKIVINLALSLMLAQLVFLRGVFQETEGDGCVATAVMLQFLYLAAFCWMNVMAFDVARTFAGKGHRTHSGSRNKVFFVYLLYAWGLPLIITALTLIVNHTGAMDVAYGNNYFCWITNPWAMVIFFVVPVVLMLLFNIVALVRVLISVRQIRKATKNMRDKSTSRVDARMCWKLTTVFGLTWILGLAAEHHISLRIIYVVFNSLQGVFIMIGFIITKRVLNMYLNKVGKQPFSTSGSRRPSTQKHTISRSEVLSRKISSTPLMERKLFATRHEPLEKETDGVIDHDSPEAQLILSIDGPETTL